MSVLIALLAVSSVGVHVDAHPNVSAARVAALEGRLTERLSARGWAARVQSPRAPCASDGATCAAELRASAELDDALFVRLVPGLSRTQLTMTRASASGPPRHFDLVISTLDAIPDASLDPALDALGFVAVVAPAGSQASSPAAAPGLSTASQALAGAGVIGALVGGVFAIRAIDQNHTLGASAFADPATFASERADRDVSVAVACSALVAGVGLIAVALFDPL